MLSAARACAGYRFQGNHTHFRIKLKPIGMQTRELKVARVSSFARHHEALPYAKASAEPDGIYAKIQRPDRESALAVQVYWDCCLTMAKASCGSLAANPAAQNA